jgi:hypothetical protein
MERVRVEEGNRGREKERERERERDEENASEKAHARKRDRERERKREKERKREREKEMCLLCLFTVGVLYLWALPTASSDKQTSTPPWNRSTEARYAPRQPALLQRVAVSGGRG